MVPATAARRFCWPTTLFFQVGAFESSKSAMKTLAPELNALIIIFRSTGPVISTRRSSRSGRMAATVHSRSRTSRVSGRKSGSLPPSISSWRRRRRSSSSWRVVSKRRASIVRKAIASPLSTLSHPGGGGLRMCTAGSIAAMFKTNQMSATLVFVALGCLALGVWCVAAALQALRQRRVVGGAGRGLLGALLLSHAALGATIAAGIRGYRALTYEEVAATVKTQPVGPQHFRATIVLPDQRLLMYDLAGDAFYVDAHILKWHPWANVIGLHTAYELDRVTRRYKSVTHQRTKPHTVYSVTRTRPADLV